MPKFSVLRTINVNAPIDNIFKILTNFNHWQAWSPWLIMEPDAKVQISGDGKSYQWFGSRVGEGKMEILSEQKNNQIIYSLNFFKPWKSKAEVSFLLSDKQDSVEITWTMHSKLPFFLFWMKKMMIAFIGKDYERGLLMLKAIAEQGEVPSKLEFKGVSESPSITYIGIKTECSQSEIAEAMGRDFNDLANYLEGHKDLINGQALSIYHKWDMVKKVVEYTAAIPVRLFPQQRSSKYIYAQIPATKKYTIKHTGPYVYLGNAWSTLYNMQQNKELKCNKHIPPFEQYMNEPNITPHNELVTEVNFPIK
ncbi:SRPBCC family protein [Paraglaciecola aquimarina]|uniref:SRPBCC family protein n=1 Tax=Paraglaciecola algarum TaxID=3050085 RepID=A0ABS9DBN9_9ALTE|nr:SRPBCC family protein [Paraglaciecola sp. G1-23]MCF2949046.1 SRPBCC family protein [Paraglaciecola sp. G1-23]